MDQTTLAQFIRESCSYFERKLPADMTFNLWIEDLKKLPIGCLPELRRGIKEADNWPKNFPRFCWHQYHQWLDANPHLKEPEPKIGCLQCHEGYITVSRYCETDYFPDWRNVIFRCRACNSIGPKAIPVRTRTELLESGYFAPAWAINHPCHKVFDKPFELLPLNHPARAKITSVSSAKKGYVPNLTQSELAAVKKAVEENAEIPF